MNVKQRKLPVLVALLGMLAVHTAAFSQSSEGLDGDVGFDQAMGLPQVMVVEAIDTKAGIVVLDGQRYRMGQESKPLMIDAPGTVLTLEQLSVGMQVVVSTDGTEPSASHTPFVRGLWAAP